MGVSIIARDISARRRVEESLRASQANMAVAQHIAHIGSWELDLTDADDIDANPLRWSDEMFRIAGYEPGAVAVTNEFFFSLIPEAEYPPIRATVAEAIGGREHYSIVHQLIRPNDEVRIVHEEVKIFFGAETGRPENLRSACYETRSKMLRECC
jgi:PAS domain-containing protein